METHKPHENPEHFVQVIENALYVAYKLDTLDRWNRVYDFYERRYLNPNSPYKKALHLYGHYTKMMS